jgi:hypothetical protein
LRKKSAQPFVTAQYTQILQCPSAASEHQDQRQDMNRRAVARRAAGRRQFTVDQVANPETVQIFAEQRQPALRGQRFVRPRQLERQLASPPCAVNDSSVPASWNDNTVCEDPTAPSR